MTWVIPPEWDGERVDRTLAHLSGSSRAAARAAIDSGAVLLDGSTTGPAARVVAGAVLYGEVPQLRTPLEAEHVPFAVLYEDDDLAVVNKPAGVVTHPGAGRRRGTLAGGILHRWPEVRGVGEEDRWGIVHRLDRDTSGLLVVALSQTAYSGLSTAIRERRVTREYLALVLGHPGSPTGTVDAPISRHPRKATRMRVDQEGRRAVTHFRTELNIGDTTLLRVTLETGRTHQIRVHMASIGLPVAGDGVYGKGHGSPRLFLHAARLAFEHPVTGVPIDVSSELPQDLQRVLQGAS